MKSVTVKKDDLVQKVQANRDAHRAIFEEAVEGYLKEAIRFLEAHIGAIKAGSVARVVVSLPEPQDHTSDYDRVLAMLAMHTGEEIEIEEDSFAAYVLDDWHWKNQFLTSNAYYSNTAARMTGATGATGAPGYPGSPGH